MKRFHSRCILPILCLGLSLALGCTSAASARDDAGTAGTTGGTGGMPSDAGHVLPPARIRLANLSFMGAAFDLCTAAHGSGQFEGPLLASEGLVAGVRYGDVSGYLAMPAGPLDFRVVPVDAGCGQDLAGTKDMTDLPPFAPGGSFTGAAIARSLQPLLILQDDAAAPDAQTAGLRFINASANTPSLDLGIVEDGGFTPWITGAQFLSVGGTAQMYSLDANGYLGVPAMPSALLEVESASKDLLDLSLDGGAGPALNGGALYTLFALTGTPLNGLLCSDLSPLQSSYADCTLYPSP